MMWAASPRIAVTVTLIDDVRLVAEGSSTSDPDTDGDLIPDSVEDATPGTRQE